MRLEAAVRGMHCAGCVATIERAAMAVPGVQSATVNLASERATIEVDPSVDATSIQEAVAKAGYKLVPERLHFRVRGLTTPEGVPGIEREWGALPGVIAARLNYGSQAATLDVFTGLFARANFDRAAARAGLKVDPLDAPAVEERDWTGLKALVSLAVAGVVMALSMNHATMHSTGWIQAALALVVQAWAASEFHAGFWRGLLRRSADMNTLISAGTTIAVAASLWALLRGGDLYFDTATMIVGITLLGRWLERRARRGTWKAIESLMELAPRTATLIRDGIEVDVPLADVKPGDIALVKPGGRVPADGVVIEGGGDVDESMMTGESKPVDKEAGSSVIGGTVNGSGALRVRVMATGEAAMLARIVRVVKEAQGSKAPVQRLADRWAAVFVPIVLAVAVATLAAWLMIRPSEALARTIAVLVVACPCALGLATPVAVVAASGRAARRGILFKTAEMVERPGIATTVVFDKTGTLTVGRPTVTKVSPASGFTREELLRWAASLERLSEHPVARAIAALDRDAPPAKDFKAIVGFGASGTLDGKQIVVGRRGLLERFGIPVPAADVSKGTVIHVARGGVAVGQIEVDDAPRPEAAGVVADLRARGIKIVMLSGDESESAQRIAVKLQIDRVIAGVLPADKAAEIAKLQEAGARVIMVGDGVNDAPALAKADVGMAVASGTDVAIESAGIVLVRGGLTKVVDVIEQSRLARRIIAENLAWAFGYNVILIPLAAGVLLPFGVALHPMAASAAMAFSSLTVVFNALRLRR